MSSCSDAGRDWLAAWRPYRLMLGRAAHCCLRAGPQHFRFTRFTLCSDSRLFRSTEKRLLCKPEASSLTDDERGPLYMIRRLMSLIQEQRGVNNLRMFIVRSDEIFCPMHSSINRFFFEYLLCARHFLNQKYLYRLSLFPRSIMTLS